jgi:hypothetical protein
MSEPKPSAEARVMFQLCGEFVIGHLILKGGGGHIGHHIHIGALTRLRHHPWTGTTDKVPRTDGTGGGLNDGMEPANIPAAFNADDPCQCALCKALREHEAKWRDALQAARNYLQEVHDWLHEDLRKLPAVFAATATVKAIIDAAIREE